jgi:hypothetical protein
MGMVSSYSELFLLQFTWLVYMHVWVGRVNLFSEIQTDQIKSTLWRLSPTLFSHQGTQDTKTSALG